MFDNVIFDADGTLLDTLPGICAGFNYALKKLGRQEVTPAQVKPFMGPPLYYTCTASLGFSASEAEKAVQYYREFYWDKGYKMCEFFPGIPELLKQLHANGKILCVATNKPQIFIDKILIEKGVHGLFTRVCGPDVSETSADKTPLVKKAAAAGGKKAVMVGDRYVDITAAKNAAIASIGVLWGSAEDEEFIQYKPDFIAKTPQDVYTVCTDPV
ncbi:MAG: HAD hydrolase-like protein [Firmicutes bacterium]|nr:HAD hydrolase-like protein [Bacillota bacterium]